MRTVRLFWKRRVTKAKRENLLAVFRMIYPSVKDSREVLTIKAPKDDTKFLWLFMLSKAFSDLQ